MQLNFFSSVVNQTSNKADCSMLTVGVSLISNTLKQLTFLEVKQKKVKYTVAISYCDCFYVTFFEHWCTVMDFTTP
jgi:hypothetical protein